MSQTLYSAKSLKGAQAEVRRLRRQREENNKLIQRLAHERLLMAMLAADTPQFFNPIVVSEAKQIRDRILKP